MLVGGRLISLRASYDVCVKPEAISTIDVGIWRPRMRSWQVPSEQTDRAIRRSDRVNVEGRAVDRRQGLNGFRCDLSC